MEHKLTIYNSLTRQKENFIPLNPPFVGLYVCGPTVYSEPHLGHVRMGINFDTLYRYLLYQGYKVRFVRNITDVGHLEDEVSGEGEDRISKRAKLEMLEPMEIVQKYKNLFNDSFNKLNILPPSIEPQASGHIIEQQTMIRNIIQNGYAYETNGSVYFDIEAYNKKHQYGKLSGRKTEDMLNNTRSLDGQSEKRNPLDFALWKKASPEHIMRWPSEWSEGFPGWHLECSAMGTKYLGETFDIHGGGMDLQFPHHECEIAQSVASNGTEHVRYWMHNNMITIDGQKMARSLNNFITLNELFNGNHERLVQAYDPNTIRFFVLQAHYRSTLDFSNEALQASEKGLKRLFNAYTLLTNLKTQEQSSFKLQPYINDCFQALNDDLNTPVAIGQLFELVRIINLINDGKESISASDHEKMLEFFKTMIIDLLGLIPGESAFNKELEEDLIQLLIDIRLTARQNKDFSTSDLLRDRLQNLGIILKDTKDGTTWERL
jgi:cysteinyl-tRNA synthetase